MPHERRIIDATGLRTFAAAVLRGMGADDDVAAEVARHLVDADLAGHGSHGVARIAEYVEAADRGDLVPAARPRVVTDRGAVTALDGQRGFGHFAVRAACETGIAKAGEFGVAAAVIGNAGHTGRLGDYAELVAARGMVLVAAYGKADCTAATAVLPGTGRRFLGANPWVVGVPRAAGPPVIVDVSTAVAAEGKVLQARDKGRPVPPGWLVDRHGRPTSDPDAYVAGGGVLPLGAPAAAHKGFGLGLAAALIGALAPAGDGRQGGVSGTIVIVIDPRFFGSLDGFRRLVDEAVAEAHRLGGAVVPGEPEAGHRHGAGWAGIALPAPVADRLLEMGRRFDVSASVLSDLTIGRDDDA
jgi:hydroxycarboxylate dehydrogenase B